MIFFKKILSYFKKRESIQIIKDILISIFFFFLFSFFILYVNEANNRKRVYENLAEIVVDEDISSAIKKMKQFTFFLEFEIQPCNYCFDYEVKFTKEVVFKHKKYNDYPNQYPRIYFDIKTNKVIGLWNGTYN